jgi:parallel beta-helix repeat protein
MTITLNVGQGSQHPSIQAAVNFLVSVYGSPSQNVGSIYTPSTPPLAEDVIIEVDEGVYGGFYIPSNTLGTSLSATLTIRSRPGQKVTLSGRETSPSKGHGHAMVGIGIGNNVPYVTIRGFRIEEFHKGIVVGEGSSNATIIQNFLQRNLNVGIWIYRSENCQIFNNVVIDHDNALVLTEISNVSVIHNDLINFIEHPATLQPGERYCIHATTRPPSSYTNPGTIVFYNNNIASLGGTLIGYGGLNVLNIIRSDYNNWHGVASTFSRELNTASPIVTNSLGQWSTISNNDFSSISASIEYYIPRQFGNSLYTDIQLDNFIIFAGRGRGLSGICDSLTAATTWNALLPHGILASYVNTSLLCDTVQTWYSIGGQQGTTALTRPITVPPGVSIGAYDIAYDPGGFATQAIVPVGSTGSGIEDPNCQIGIYDTVRELEERYGQSVKCIVPSVVPGFFYINDIEHYLYSRKAAYFLDDITATDFILPTKIVDKKSHGINGVTIEVNGSTVPKSGYNIIGNILRLYHRGLDIRNGDQQIIIRGTDLKWKVDGFKRETVNYIPRVRDGKTRYFLPVAPTMGAPICITDDNITYADDLSMLGREFSIAHNDEEKKTELTFAGRTNLLENPQFDYWSTEVSRSIANLGRIYPPANWSITGSTNIGIVNKIDTSKNILTGVLSSGGLDNYNTLFGTFGTRRVVTGYTYTTSSTGYVSLHPQIGKYFTVFSGGTVNTHGIRQRVKINEKSPYWLTLYGASIKGLDETDYIRSSQIDVGWQYFDIDYRPLSNHTGDTYAGRTSLIVTSNYKDIDGLWTRVGVVFSNTIDQTKNKPEHTGFFTINSMKKNPVPIPKGAKYIDITIGSTGYTAIDAVQFCESIDAPYYTRRYRGHELTIEYDTGETILYNINDLTLTPIRNINSNGFLYIGAIPARQFDKEAPTNATTLTDWAWSTGRIEHLPWARLSGKNKLRQRANFNLDIQGVVEDVAIVPSISYPEDIVSIPRIPISNISDGLDPSEQISESSNDPSPGIKGTDITVRVTDNNGNPYAFEGVTAVVVDDTESITSTKYVGMLGVREFGFYTQYGNRVHTRTDSAGSTVLRWIPPPPSMIQVDINDVFILGGQVHGEVIENRPSFYIDELPYRVSEFGMGNVFMSTPKKPFGYNITGSFVEEIVQPIYTNEGIAHNVNVYRLTSVPYSQDLRLYVNHTGNWYLPGTGETLFTATSGTYDLLLNRSYIPEINEGQYFVDEGRKLVFSMFNKHTNDPFKSARINYPTRQAYLLYDDNGLVYDRRIYFTEEFYSTLKKEITPDNPLSVIYDITVDMVVVAHSPTGIVPRLITIQNTGGLSHVNAWERHLNVKLIGKNTHRRVGI